MISSEREGCGQGEWALSFQILITLNQSIFENDLKGFFLLLIKEPIENETSGEGGAFYLGVNVKKTNGSIGFALPFGGRA